MLDMGFLPLGDAASWRPRRQAARRFCSRPPSTSRRARPGGRHAATIRPLCEIAAQGRDGRHRGTVHRRTCPSTPEARPSGGTFEGDGGTSASSSSPARAIGPTPRCRKLKRAGYHAEAIHSDRSQNQRKRALDNFASGETDILVATDVLARGIDVDEVSYVVNYDVPTQAEDYVHRIGRTGRAGSRRLRDHLRQPREQRRAGGHREAHQARHPRD